MSDRDRLYLQAGEEVAPFVFSEEVVRVFPDMIERSVPGYRLLLELTASLVRQAAQPQSRIYDLGCSLGAATLTARRAVQKPGVSMIALDNSPSMVARCRQIVADDNSIVPVEVIEGDVLDLPIGNASVVMMYFTLQFIAPAERAGLLQKIARGLRPGGVLLLAEKMSFTEPVQSWMDRHHHDFKRAQGYSDLEIARKRQALERVLIADSRSSHHERLRAAGFDQVIDWFQCLNFSALVATKA